MKRNIGLLIEYDGTNYMGWQKQLHGQTVQGTIETALKKILNQKVNLIGASRTDAGVHAFGQFANFFTDSQIPLYKLQKGLNGLFPYDIKIIEVKELPDSFHSRFSSKGKKYIYRIFNRKIPSPFEYKRSWHISYNINLELLNKALSYFIGTHDFKTFSKISDKEKINTVRTIDHIKVSKEKETVAITYIGRSFLRHMIRVITATAVNVAIGKVSLEKIPEMFEAKNREAAPFLAPPEGLYLAKVYYENYPFEGEK